MRFTSYVLLTAFCIWILPLGFFIKPSQEKEVCDGQRALCMCSSNVAKSATAVAGGKFALASIHPGVNKEAPSSGGASHYYELAQSLAASMVAQPNDLSSPLYLASLSIIRTIEHVPKA